MIISGASLRDVAGQFRISKSSVDRHRPHISIKVAKAADARERLSAEKLLDVMENLMGEAIATLRDAKASGDNRVRLQAIREARETARVLLEVAGELENGGQTITIINNPQWTAIRTVILQTLEPYPEAKGKLVAALTEVSE